MQTAPAAYARLLADKAVLDVWAGVPGSLELAERALSIARPLGDPVLLARALTACGFVAGNSDKPDLAQRYFAEGIPLANCVAAHAHAAANTSVVATPITTEVNSNRRARYRMVKVVPPFPLPVCNRHVTDRLSP